MPTLPAVPPGDHGGAAIVRMLRIDTTPELMISLIYRKWWGDRNAGSSFGIKSWFASRKPQRRYRQEPARAQRLPLPAISPGRRDPGRHSGVIERHNICGVGRHRPGG